MADVISDMPPGTLGFRISGKLTREDYIRLLIPPLEAAVAKGEKLRVLYEIDPGLGMTPGAMWEDIKMEPKYGIKHREAWERIAVVTDLQWLWRSFELFSWMVPGEMKLFHEGEMDAAKAWVAE